MSTVGTLALRVLLTSVFFWPRFKLSVLELLTFRHLSLTVLKGMCPLNCRSNRTIGSTLQNKYVELDLCDKSEKASSCRVKETLHSV